MSLGERRYRLIALLVLGALFTIASLSGCQGSPARNPESDEALRKAEQLQEKLEEAGLPVPHTDTLTRLYGTDGGVAGVYSGSDFQTYYNLIHFGNTGNRPAYLDPDVIAYDEAVLEVYAPDRLKDYREAVTEWRKKTKELLPE